MQKRQIIAYEFKKLTFEKLNYPTHEKELLVVIHPLKIWSHYLSKT
jgi:hypothetical protein